MAISALTQAALKYYETENASRTGKQIDEVLFPQLDESENTTVEIDEYTGQGYAISVVRQGAPAHVVAYSPGSGNEFEVQTLKAKSPIDESLCDARVAGIEPKSPQGRHIAKIVSSLVSGPKGFIPSTKVARIKMALDVIFEGKMIARDEGGNTVEVDFLRDATLDDTYDFAGVDATFDASIKQAFDALHPFGMPMGNLAVLLGSDWLLKFQTDARVIQKCEANNFSAFISTTMKPSILDGAEGLFVVGQYKVDGLIPPVWILAYQPEWDYVGYKGATAAPFVATDEMAMFNVGATAWRFNRGIVVLDERGQLQRRVGDLVIDSYTDNDPPIEWLRATCRPFYARGNINHTYRCTGSNFTS